MDKKQDDISVCVGGHVSEELMTHFSLDFLKYWLDDSSSIHLPISYNGEGCGNPDLYFTIKKK